MTNEEIKKGLELCKANWCVMCPYSNCIGCEGFLKQDALTLITKQEQEIEWLKEVIKNYKEALCETTQQKDDAIKLNDKLIDEYEIKVKQAKIDVLNELKKKIHDTRLNDDTAEIIIEMIEEYEK